jgi:Acyl-CoA dehydrogenase, middle domain
MAVDTAALGEMTDIQRDITEMVRQLVDERIIPDAERYDHEDSFPEKFGTDEQTDYFLPKMETGEIRAAFSLSEPEVGSDIRGIKSTAKKGEDKWELNGQKMWVTNGLGSSVVFVLMKTSHPNPVLDGDTLFCETEVLEKRESKSKPDRGTVKVRTRVLNQDGILVAEFKRLVLVPRRTAGAE